MLETLHWLGHDTFRVDGPPVVVVDPYELAGEQTAADLVLITHDHYDHCSPADVARLRRPDTVIVAPASAAAKLPGSVQVIAAGDVITVAGVQVRAVRAYNTNKRFHPLDAGGVGYLFSVAGITYYHAGDTDRIPEMQGLRPDVALLPVSGTYVMTAEEAAAAARDIAPRIAVPMHYGAIVGDEGDARRFAELLADTDIEVVIKQRE